MMNKKINLVLFFLFSAFLTQTGCGGSGGGGDGPGEDFNIDIPDGYSLYGTVNGTNFEVLEQDGDISVFVADGDKNGKFDNDESLGITITNSSAFDDGDYSIYVSAYTSPGVGYSYETDTAYFSTTGFVYTKTGGSSLIRYNLSSSKIIFTNFETSEGGKISGMFDLILEDNKGELKGKFDGFLKFIYPEVPD